MAFLFDGKINIYRLFPFDEMPFRVTGRSHGPAAAPHRSSLMRPSFLLLIARLLFLFIASDLQGSGGEKRAPIGLHGVWRPESQHKAHAKTQHSMEPKTAKKLSFVYSSFLYCF